MTTKNILKVLNQMLSDWKLGYENPLDKKIIFDKYIDSGFCRWLSNNDIEDILIYNELKKDCLIYTSSWWYPSVEDYFFIEIYKDEILKALKYRIDHLKRTISRLEQELQK